MRLNRDVVGDSLEQLGSGVTNLIMAQRGKPPCRAGEGMADIKLAPTAAR